MSLLSRLAVQAARAYGILSARSTNVSADYLVVAGGGGGGFDEAGGGGAGGYQTSTFTLSTLNTYSITVGDGGNKASVTATKGANGGNSVISGTGITTVTSTGGGGGGSEGNTTGASGGSGGGGRSRNSAAGGSGTVGQGNNGGNGASGASDRGGGGGGGASAVGGTGSLNAGAAGGAGSSSSISGSSVTYAGGGGGGGSTGGAGGAGGGGAGAGPSNPVDGTANTGGGGGGGDGGAGALQQGANGGSGIVIISYTSATPKFVGGTITTSGGKQIHTFTSSGTLSPITPITASYLVVAGGGGGGAERNGGGSGGGGAGGYQTSSTTLYSGATYVVTVGGGGAGAAAANPANSGTQGSNSVLSGTGITTITSTGGGFGGAQSTSTVGGNGGSGGGGWSGGASPPYAGGTGTSGQGNNGGSGNTTGNTGGGGGGGASAVGGSWSGTNGSNNGGAGTASSITGTSVTYAGGGGGGVGAGTASTGGTGGGGAGGSGAGGHGTSGTPNLGGGGGGAGGNNATPGAGGSGGSGIVIISYAGSQVFNGGLVTTSGGNTIHTFTSSGALTPLTNNLNNSLRFRSSASAYLSRTPTLAGSTTIGTFSNWLKLGAISTDRMMYHVIGTSGNNNRFYITFNADNTFQIVGYNSSASIVLNLNTTQVLRDPSAWYHIVVAIDTTQATSSNRAKLYINGNQVTAFSTATYPSQNQALGFTNNTSTFIGANQGPANYFDGYMTDINFIDGQALEPYYFGNNDANGVWKPIQYKGTYGTNGFYLTFGNTTSTTTLGYDSSPNGNNWTCNNISLTAGTTYDAMTDVPTNTSATVGNYCTINPLLDLQTYATYSEANLKVSTTASAGFSMRMLSKGTMAIPSSGKWYFVVNASDCGIGMANDDPNRTQYGPAISTTHVRYQSGGDVILNGSVYATVASFTSTDEVGLAIDMDALTVGVYKNGSLLTTVTGVTSGFTYYPMTIGNSSATAYTAFWNFGQRPFAYTPPSGYKTLNTFNLPTPTILQGNKYMDATLYTGTGAAQVIVNQGQFKPDLVWIKSRNNITNNNLTDSVRGVTKIVFSNSANAEATASVGLTSFDNNGFSLATGGDVGFSASGYTYVGWQWQAGQGSTSSNTSGTITSTVSVNTTAGFSVVTYTGTGANATVGHGLGVAPKMIIVKGRSIAESWRVGHNSVNGGSSPWNYYMALNLTNAAAAASTVWNNTAPTSSVFSIGTDSAMNSNTNTYVAYCFAEIAGFSAFGSYTGNGSTDGPFVFTGFRPKFVMIKRTDAANDWNMYDSRIGAYNVIDDLLKANTTAAETTYYTYYIDFLSNGFKLRETDTGQNASGGTYIFMAFAENPFKNANAR